MDRRIAAALLAASACLAFAQATHALAGQGAEEARPPPVKRARPVMGGITPSDLAALDLSAEQREKVTAIQRDVVRAQDALMASAREARWKQQDAMKAPELDVDAARSNYEALAALRKKMFETSIEGRKRIEAVLTREQLRLLAQHRVAASH